MEKILIIGNGFDLAHGLPTKYEHFLDFCRLYLGFTRNGTRTTAITAESMAQQLDRKANAGELDHVHSAVTAALTDVLTDNRTATHTAFAKVSAEFLQLVKDNSWIAYFQKRRRRLGGNWIDFETEIGRVLAAFSSASQDPFLTDSPDENAPAVSELYDHFSQNYPAPDFFYRYYFPANTRQPVFSSSFEKWWKKNGGTEFVSEELIAHLNDLIRALEIYLSVIVGNIRKEDAGSQIPEITDNNFNYVLSFNYTSTFRKIYKKQYPQICFIHGRAETDKNEKTCNLVLGIHENSLADAPPEIADAVLPFQKFYQRIYKGTDDNYLDWLDYIHSMKDRQFELHIFGHSLDITDKEVLEKFILNDNVHTKIYYYREEENDKTEMGRQIRNLIHIIGRDQLIRKTGGSSRTIEFIPLKPQKAGGGADN